jgi:hypothetical protein
MLLKEECAVGMGQNCYRRDAATMVVKTILRKEECALSMGQRSKTMQH